MAIKTDAELKTQVDAVIKINGNREITPPLHNAIETNIIDSKLNVGAIDAVIDPLVSTTELLFSSMLWRTEDDRIVRLTIDGTNQIKITDI